MGVRHVVAGSGNERVEKPWVPLGIIIRCFIAASFSRPLKIGGPDPIRQGECAAHLV